MIKFTATAKNGQTLLGLGLSEGNVQKLKEGDPMYFSLEELGIEGLEVTVVYGETEDQIVRDLKKQGLVVDEEIDQR